MAVLVFAAPASGHFLITMSCRVLFNFDAGAINAFGQSWTFDPAYSRQLLADFDADGDGIFDPPEVETIRQTGLSRLADANYLTFVSIDNAFIGQREPYTFNAVVKDGIVTFAMSMALPEPVDPVLHTLKVEIRDPGHGIEAVFAAPDPIGLTGAANGNCTGKITSGSAPGVEAASIVCTSG